MDYRKLNKHIVLLGVVIVAGLFAGIVVRMAMLGRGADAGTANLMFVFILGASAVLYLIIITTLSNSVIPWIMRRLPAPKKVVVTSDKFLEPDSEMDEDDSGEEETPIIDASPAPESVRSRFFKRIDKKRGLFFLCLRKTAIFAI